MKKSELEERRKLLNNINSDSVNDFEDIVISGQAYDSAAKIVHIPLESLVEYSDDAFKTATGRDQPFKAYSKENLDTLAKSIKENGVINPIIVRPLDNGTYQILAGRNRKRAARLCGKETIPAIIRSDIDDDSAALIMLDTNLEQRPNLSYSEKAYAYKMRVDLYKSKGKRTDVSGGRRQDVLSDVGKDNNDSRRMVAYLIRLTYLIVPLMEMVDEGKLGFKIGVSISYLKPETQSLLYSYIILTGHKVKQFQIKELNVLDKCGTVNTETLKTLFQNTEKTKNCGYTVSPDILSKYADILPDTGEIERLFTEFLENYRCSLNKNDLVQRVH